MNKRMLFKDYTKNPHKYLSTEAEAGDSAKGLGIYRRCQRMAIFFRIKSKIPDFERGEGEHDAPWPRPSCSGPCPVKHVDTQN